MITTPQENRALHFEPLLAAAGNSRLAGSGHHGLDMQRTLAAQQFVQRGLPSRSDEAWRYTSLDALLDTHWARREQETVIDPRIIDRHALVDAPLARLVFIDGRWNPRLSNVPSAESRIRIGSLRAALEEHPEAVAAWLGGAQLSSDPAEATELPGFAALNTALLEDGAWIHIDAGVRPSAPIELLYISASGETGKPDSATASLPRNLIVLEDGASATIVEHYVGAHDAACFTNAVTEVQLRAEAQIEHVRLQDEGSAARHLSHVYLRQGRGSRYRGFHVSLGGLWSRTEFHNRMGAENAQFVLEGLYVAGDRQLTDVHLDIDHAVPNCVSREHFKGILLGRGRAVFDGRVRVRPDAQKTDAQLANDNLLLSRDAEIDTKPQLEIYADDVKCSHGATVGQLEPSQLFYLRARGIDETSARRMLCVGFALETLEACSIPGLRARVEQRLAERLVVAPPPGEAR